jgi:2-keto-4-pentenoate hydratase/2-oxohepta-3-ene-1,7-dioic acid hydratase in catechol pathway
MLPAAVAALGVFAANVGQSQVPMTPDTPFKLATFTTDGPDRLGMLIGDQLVDLHQANVYVVEEARLTAVELPSDMRTLIERSEALMPRLFQIANFLGGRMGEIDFAMSPADVSLRAPIKYPWNLLAAAQNYRAHAREMGGSTEVDPDERNPYLFAKSPRSTIIDPGQTFVIPPGRNTIDWEGEFSVVLGREAKNLTLDDAMDYVFGFTVVYDLSDRAAQIPTEGPYDQDWFPGKSLDDAAPMGPYLVPKEFLPNYGRLRLITRVNGEVMQDSDTSYLIHDVEHLLRYATSVMTLWPGDVIATGTPSGVGHGRNPRVYLKPGDVVEIEVEGIGTLVTPIQ